MLLTSLPQSYLWGLLPGFITAFGGAYKDTLFEPFAPLKFFRSPIIAFVCMMERITVETYKAVYRPAPGKFKNCECVRNECVLHKDRGWFLDRLRGA